VPALHAVAESQVAEFVPADGYFAEHEVCGSSTQWINGPSLTRISTKPYFKVKDQAFHPEVIGQTQYAALISQYLGS